MNSKVYKSNNFVDFYIQTILIDFKNVPLKLSEAIMKQNRKTPDFFSKTIVNDQSFKNMFVLVAYNIRLCYD
jgi:hypothetical protein